MSTYTAKCMICGTDNVVESYGDWACSKCGQGYTYDECHMITLTYSQREMLRNPPRWISVTERLPNEGERVLVFDKAFLQPEMGTYYSTDGWVGDEIASLDPTHWVPLPEPPEVT